MKAAWDATQPRFTQMSRGVRPSSATMDGSAPLNNNNSMHRGLSRSAAKRSGVQPFRPTDFLLISALRSNNASMTSTRPLHTAIVRAVFPQEFSMST